MSMGKNALRHALNAPAESGNAGILKTGHIFPPQTFLYTLGALGVIILIPILNNASQKWRMLGW